MSYATIKADYTTALSGYTECKNLLEFNQSPLSYNHKFYVLKVEGFSDLETLSESTVLTSYRMRLEVRYENNDTTQRDANFALWVTLVKAIAAVDDFAGEEENSFLDEEDGYHTIGTLVFYAGAEGC